MKRVISMFVAMASLFVFGDKDPTKAYVNYWSSFEMSEDKNVTVTYADGSTQTFYGGSFVEEETDINTALDDYYSAYTELQATMQGGGMKSSQISYNMGIWTEKMTAAMYKGIAEQNIIDAKRIKDAEGDTQAAAEAVAELQESTVANMEALKGSLDGSLSQISKNNSQLITSLAASVANTKQELEEKMAELEQNKGADDAVVKGLQAETQKLSQDVAAMNKAIAKLKESENTLSKSELENYVTIPSYSNTLKRISRYLGYTNENTSGIFKLPINPYTGESYGDDETIDNYLSDSGVIIYLRPDITTESRYSDGFIGELDEKGVTNVTATFNAPMNWADAATIVCTNGAYSVHPNYQFITNIVWATNWTDAVKTITKNETTNIVNVVTNLVQNYQNITTQVHKVEVFTNWYEMVQWTTNVTVNVISNHQSFLNITTNMIHHENFVTNAVTLYSSITNFHEFFTFHTNTFYHENFVTNMIYHERTIEDFVTNNIHAVNYWCTNEYHVVTNVVSEITNTMQIVTNVINTTVNVFRMPQIIWDPFDPEYRPAEDPYNPESPYNPINDPDWKDDPENPFYNSAIGELERQMDDVTNKLVSASNELHKISGGYSWVTNNFDDITNSINVLKSFKNNVKIYNAISNGTYVSMWLDHKSIGTNESGLAEMKGFEKAGEDTYPVKVKDEELSSTTNDVYKLEWQHVLMADSDVIGRKNIQDTNPAGRSIDRRSVYTFDEELNMNGVTNFFELSGFRDAPSISVPYAYSDDQYAGRTNELRWVKCDTNQIEITGLLEVPLTTSLGIRGFESASEGYVPFKKKIADSNPASYEIGWTNIVAGAITVASETHTTPVAASNILFKAAADTNCEFDISEENGTAVISVHVYWK